MVPVPLVRDISYVVNQPKDDQIVSDSDPGKMLQEEHHSPMSIRKPAVKNYCFNYKDR